uniref:N-alpha-acetyltransferase 40 isoform X2 n=1 Tax=Rhizophora mucronata TaxID=61149 RepID=A0A2P2LKW7_RHIMU
MIFNDRSSKQLTTNDNDNFLQQRWCQVEKCQSAKRYWKRRKQLQNC